MARSSLRSALLASAVLAASAASLAGCSATPSITGVWTSDDGSATKTINDDGSCSGMYYNGSRVLDIGGPETCQLSEQSRNGYYDLVVRQAPNQETLQVTFDGDTMTLYSGSSRLATLTKQ